MRTWNISETFWGTKTLPKRLFMRDLATRTIVIYHRGTKLAILELFVNCTGINMKVNVIGAVLDRIIYVSYI